MAICFAHFVLRKKMCWHYEMSTNFVDGYKVVDIYITFMSIKMFMILTLAMWCKYDDCDFKKLYDIDKTVMKKILTWHVCFCFFLHKCKMCGKIEDNENVNQISMRGCYCNTYICWFTFFFTFFCGDLNFRFCWIPYIVPKLSICNDKGRLTSTHVYSFVGSSSSSSFFHFHLPLLA